MTNEPVVPNSQFLVYRDETGAVKIDVRLEAETVWLAQQGLADLFQTSLPNINEHIANIYDEGELQSEATECHFVMERREGTRTVRRPVLHYNLDMIISVGYRVKSGVATRFRIWATQQLRELIIKGFVMDDERLKNPDHRTHDAAARHPGPPDVPSTATIVRERAAELEPEWEQLGRPFDRRFLDAALAATATLGHTESTLAVNGDLHFEQVLAGTREPWLVVDPVLLRGDIEYDLARILWSRLDEMDDDDIQRHIDTIVREADLDRGRARSWIIYRAVDYWLWGLAFGLTEDPVRCARLARVVLPSRRRSATTPASG